MLYRYDVKQGRVVIDGYQDIQIAVPFLLAAGTLSEHPYVPSAVAGCNAQDLVPLVFQRFVDFHGIAPHYTTSAF